MQARTAPLYSRAPFHFSLLLLIAVVGFYPSYYAKLGEAKAVHQFHGLMATLWMLLLIGQGWLMRRRQVSLHRTIGRLSMILVPLFFISGLLVVHDMLTRDSGFARTFGPRLAFIDLSTMLYFVFAYCMAIHYRRNMQLHARFMVTTALPLLSPALARLLGNLVPWVNSFDLAFHLSMIASELIVAALLLDDRRMGKVRAPYLILLAVLLVQHASYEFSMKIELWRAVVAWIMAL